MLEEYQKHWDRIVLMNADDLVRWQDRIGG